MIREELVTDWRRGYRVPGLTELSACRLLRQLAAGVPADQEVVELGAYRGRATGWLLLGAQDGHGAHVTSIDPWEMRVDGYDRYSHRYVTAERQIREYVAALGATDEQHSMIRGYATNEARRWQEPPVGLLWHDAEHSADAVAADLDAWLPHLSETAVVVLHDAGNPRCGVVDGAGRVFAGNEGWDWAGRELQRWPKRPGKRGLLVVRRSP